MGRGGENGQTVSLEELQGAALLDVTDSDLEARVAAGEIGFREAAKIAEARDSYGQKLDRRRSYFRLTSEDEPTRRRALDALLNDFREVIDRIELERPDEKDPSFWAAEEIAEARRLLGAEIIPRVILFENEALQSVALDWVETAQRRFLEFEQAFVSGDDAAAQRALALNFWPDWLS